MADNVVISDSVNILVIHNRVRTISQTVDSTEQTLRQKARNTGASETTAITEQLPRTTAKVRARSETVEITDAVNRVPAKSVSKGITETVDVSESIARVQAKSRITEEITLIEEELKAYKNDVELVPGAPPVEIPAPQVLLGARVTRLRRFPRPPRLYKQIQNTVYAPLKVLAFAQGQHRALTPLRLIHRLQTVLLKVRAPALEPKQAKAPLLVARRLVPIKCSVRLSIPIRPQTARANIRLSQPELTKAIESLRPIDAVKVDRLTRLATLALLVDSL
jgi:hypothetical protein